MANNNKNGSDLQLHNASIVNGLFSGGCSFWGIDSLTIYKIGILSIDKRVLNEVPYTIEYLNDGTQRRYSTLDHKHRKCEPIVRLKKSDTFRNGESCDEFSEINISDPSFGNFRWSKNRFGQTGQLSLHADGINVATCGIDSIRSRIIGIRDKIITDYGITLDLRYAKLRTMEISYTVACDGRLPQRVRAIIMSSFAAPRMTTSTFQKSKPMSEDERDVETISMQSKGTKKPSKDVILYDKTREMFAKNELRPQDIPYKIYRFEYKLNNKNMIQKYLDGTRLFGTDSITEQAITTFIQNHIIHKIEESYISLFASSVAYASQALAAIPSKGHERMYMPLLDEVSHEELYGEVLILDELAFLYATFPHKNGARLKWQVIDACDRIAMHQPPMERNIMSRLDSLEIESFIREMDRARKSAMEYGLGSVPCGDVDPVPVFHAVKYGLIPGREDYLKREMITKEHYNTLMSQGVL